MAIINYFEINSAFGRIFFKRKPKLKDGINYLNLGSGKIKIDGWITSDFYPNIFPNFFKLSKYKKNADWVFDFRYPMNCDKDVWDGVYTSHTLEHLDYKQVSSLLKELYRTMKKGAWLRIVLPDIKKYVEFYNEKDSNLGIKEKFNTGAEAISNITQNYGHKSAWDFELLNIYLKNSGFTNIKEVSFGNGTDKNIILDIEGRKYESFYAEAQKN